MQEDASVSEHLLEWLVNVLPTGFAETAGDAACGELMPLTACAIQPCAECERHRQKVRAQMYPQNMAAVSKANPPPAETAPLSIFLKSLHACLHKACEASARMKLPSLCFASVLRSL